MMTAQSDLRRFRHVSFSGIAAMFRDAAAFMGLMEHRHTMMVSMSAAG